MGMRLQAWIGLVAAAGLVNGAANAAPPTMADVLAASSASDWQDIDANKLVVLSLPTGDVVIELAPHFAPLHVANLRLLLRQRYFDGLAVVRSQDNYVAQWGDPADAPERARALGAAKPVLDGEFARPADAIALARLDSADAYADTVGFAAGFPAASDGKKTWLTHCYAMVGVGRGNPANSGNASSLYVVTGHAPRHLDRNVTLLGRVLDGMQHLSSLPRGTGPLGFYTSAEELVQIRSMRLSADMAPADRPRYQRLKTDTATFRALVESRRTRHEDWFLDPVGRIGLCNVPIPSRQAP